MTVPPTTRTGSELVARVGVALAAALAAAGISAQLVDFWALHLRFGWLDSSSEHSIFVRIGTFAILGCAVGAFALARRNRSALAASLGLVTGWLFVDGLLGLHERIPHWTLLYVPLLGATVVGFWRLALPFPPAARRLVRAALLLLVASAAIHRLGPSVLSALGWGPDAWEYQVKIAIKEATEICGWLLLASGLAARYAAYR
jgi:hypothetical protein